MSAIYRELEEASSWIRLIITTVGDVLGLDYHGVGSTTVRKRGDGPFKGVGREPDQSFFLQNVDRRPKQGRLPDLADGGPPPDLWVEVDHLASSRARLPVDARLGVPEVWQYRVERQTLVFHRLVDGRYVPTDRSLAVPLLSPERGLEAIVPGVDMNETDFMSFLETWIPALIARAAADDPRPE